MMWFRNKPEPIIEYRVMVWNYWVNGGYNRISFEEVMNQALADGWKLQGGISVNKDKYHQAMYRVKEISDE